MAIHSTAELILTGCSRCICWLPRKNEIDFAIPCLPLMRSPLSDSLHALKSWAANSSLGKGGSDSGHIRPELPRPALLGHVEQASAVICMKGSISANSLVSCTVALVHCLVDFA